MKTGIQLQPCHTNCLKKPTFLLYISHSTVTVILPFTFPIIRYPSCLLHVPLSPVQREHQSFLWSTWIMSIHSFMVNQLLQLNNEEACIPIPDDLSTLHYIVFDIVTADTVLNISVIVFFIQVCSSWFCHFHFLKLSKGCISFNSSPIA